MIEDLHIENYALIDRISLEFSAGMNVLTGETGAGKSILTGALSLLLGLSPGKSVVRNGSEQAVVSGTFNIADSAAAKSWLEAQNIQIEDDRIVIRRVLKLQGKSSAFIQGSVVTLQQLSEFTTLILDMHGQHEHQSLFNTAYHRKFLDSFGNCQDLQQSVQRDFLYLSEVREELIKLKANEAERERNLELLRFAIKEIDELHPSPAEDSELEAERQRLTQYQDLFSHTKSAQESAQSGLTNLHNTLKAVRNMSEIDASQKNLSKGLESIYYDFEDILSQINSYKSLLSFDPQRLEFIEERTSDLYKLKQKYGGSIEDLLRYRQEAERKLEQLENSDEYLAQLHDKIRKLEKEFMLKANELSTKRKSAAVRLESEVLSCLHSLGMSRAQFKVNIRQRMSERNRPLYGPTGIDSIEFLLSANQGEPLKPLKEIASGGEISRVMLAIKNSLAENDEIPTLVFDEIDTGIGGEVGQALGKYLKHISMHKQVFCITHLASIAVFAESHILINKNEAGGRTITQAEQITGNTRIQEIARMLSGYSNTEVSFEHARQLLQQATSEVP